MERSQFVEDVFQDSLILCNGIDPNTKEGAKEIVDIILTIAVKKGMLPPTAENYTYDNIKNKNQWED